MFWNILIALAALASVALPAAAKIMRNQKSKNRRNSCGGGCSGCPFA